MPAPRPEAPVPQHPTSYLIQINEAQRIALSKLLAASDAQFQQPDPDCIDPIDSGYHPLYYWHAMLEELPRLEAQHPGSINGFCL